MKKRNLFNLSFHRLLSCKAGYIVPIGITDALPGDTIQLSTSVLIRVSPLLAPVMHPVHVTLHHWSVPYRLLWDDFEDFITGGPDGMNASIPPYIESYEAPVGSLADYLGVPTGGAIAQLSSLPFRAYQLVYDEWYRDEDLTPAMPIPKTSGKDTAVNLSLLRYPWAKDYFTTARPWPQKGPEVTVPINVPTSSQATITNSVYSNPLQPNPYFIGNSTQQAYTVDATVASVQDTSTESGFSQVSRFGSTTFPPNPSDIIPRTESLKWGDPALAVASTFTPGAQGIGALDINDLRMAQAVQRFEEHRAIYGSRYDELLRQLGVRAQDARLQRPEYIGGSRETIQFSEVLQTAEGTSPVGEMRGHGIGAMRNRKVRYFVPEHSFILSVLMIRPIAIYMQGLPRMWSRRTKLDYFTPELQHVGQQEVLNKELYAFGDNPDGVFGYQNVYDEYRQHESGVSGEFRDTLNYWHMARDFESEPVLNNDFITAPPTSRIYASTEADQFYIMAYHNLKARRIMSKFGNPI